MIARSRRPAVVPARARGFTLVEMMLALVAGLIVSTAVLAFFLSSMKSTGEYVQSTRLTQELRNSMDLMSRDLRRAGYDDDGLKYVGNTNISPFTPVCLTAGGAPITCLQEVAITGSVANSTGDCIIYGYDRSYPNNQATKVGTEGSLDLSNGEVRAMRLRPYTVGPLSNIGVLEYFDSSITSARPLCAGVGPAYSATAIYPGCNTTTGWCPLSDPARIDVTALTIVNQGSTIGANPSAQIARQFDITITGRLRTNPGTGFSTFTRNVQSSIKIRSDCMRALITDCNASP